MTRTVARTTTCQSIVTRHRRTFKAGQRVRVAEVGAYGTLLVSVNGQAYTISEADLKDES